MTNNITYNQLIAIFEDFQKRHYNLYTFFSGDIYKLEDKEDIQYPLLAVFPGNVTANKTNEYIRSISYNYNIIVGDVLKNDDTNEDELRSDTLQIIMDLLAELNQDPFYQSNNIIIETSSNCEPFTEKLDDIITGWNVGITIIVPFKYTPCTAPHTKKTLTELIESCNV